MKLTVQLFLMLAYLAFVFCSVGFSIYGVYLAFCASVILGIITLFVPPAAFAFGAIQLFFHTNLPNMILEWLSSHHG